MPDILLSSDGTVVAYRIKWARTPWQRMRGLLRGPGLADGEAFILCRAAQVHTIGLGYDIDVVFCDKRWVVKRVLAPLRRNRLSPLVMGARYAIELRAGAAAGVAPGSVLSLTAEGRRSRS
ncbi:hypothetical protein BH18ACT16_BH18ACT16_13840 [soil metagenome]